LFLEDTNSGNYLLSQPHFFVGARTNRIIVADGLHKSVYKVAHVLLFILGGPDDDSDILLRRS
jgi:hypothetical protein